MAPTPAVLISLRPRLEYHRARESGCVAAYVGQQYVCKSPPLRTMVGHRLVPKTRIGYVAVGRQTHFIPSEKLLNLTTNRLSFTCYRIRLPRGSRIGWQDAEARVFLYPERSSTPWGLPLHVPETVAEDLAASTTAVVSLLQHKRDHAFSALASHPAPIVVFSKGEETVPTGSNRTSLNLSRTLQEYMYVSKVESATMALVRRSYIGGVECLVRLVVTSQLAQREDVLWSGRKKVQIRACACYIM